MGRHMIGEWRPIAGGLIFCRPITARTQTMIDAYRAGQTMTAIGLSHGLSRERIRQLLTRSGVARAEGGFVKNCAEKRAMLVARQEQKRDARCRERWGISREEYLALCVEYGGSSRNSNPLRSFAFQRRNAATRGIGWEFTFPEWWRVWQESGHWRQRGRGQGYCMARYADAGPYSASNVYICTIGQNFADSYLVDKPNRRKSRGFTLHRYKVSSGHRYMAHIGKAEGKKFFGGFDTPEAAEEFARERLAA